MRLILFLLITNLALDAATHETEAQIDPKKNYTVLCNDNIAIEISGDLILQSDMLQNAFQWALQHKKPFALSETNQDILTLLNDLNKNHSVILEIKDIATLASLLNFTFYLQIDLNNSLCKSLLQQFIQIFHTLDIPMKREAYNDLSPDIQKSVSYTYLMTYYLKYLFDNNLMSYELFKTLDHNINIGSITISSDNNFIITGSYDHKARIWNAQTGQLLQTLNHNDQVTSVAISSNNNFIVTGSWDGKARIWNTQTSQLLQTLNHDGWVEAIAISSDNSLIITGSADNKVRIWNTQTGQLLKTLDHDGWVEAIAISSDNSFIVTGSRDNKAKIWNTQTGQLLNTLNHDDKVTSVAISSDNNFIVTKLHCFKIIIWSAQTGQLLKTLDDGHGILSVAISSNNNFIVTTSYDNKAIIWDIHTGELLKTLNHDDLVWSAAISSSMPAPSTKLLATHKIHNANRINYTFVNTGNSFIVTVAKDKTARIWNTQTGELLKTLDHDGEVRSVAISSDNNFIVTGSDDKKARIWKFISDFNPIDIFRKLVIPEDVPSKMKCIIL